MAKLKFFEDDKKKKLPVLEKASNTTADTSGTKILSYNPDKGGAVSRDKKSVIDWYEGSDNPTFVTKAADTITKIVTGSSPKRTTKSDLLDEYQAAKEQQISDALKDYTGNADIPMLAGTYANQFLHPIQYDKAMNEIAPYLEEKGITTDQLAKYYATQALREQNRQMQNTAADNGFGNTMLSFATNQIGNVATGAGALESMLTGNPLGSNPVVNEYGKLTPTIRGAIRQDIKDNADTKVGGAIGAGAYDVATGIGDQLMSLALTGGSKMGTLGLMSYGAGAGSLNEQLGKDTSDAQKMATAVTSGLIEGLTEYLPLDNLFRLAKGGAGSTVRQIVTGVVGQMLSEAGEEAVSEVANAITDNIINGAQSDYSQNVNAYVAQGMTQEQAEKQAVMDVAGNAVYSAVIGGISGGIMGGGAITMNALGNRGNVSNNNTIPAVEQLQQNAPQAEVPQASNPLPVLNRIGVEAESDAQRNAELANLLAIQQRINEANAAEDLEGSLNRQLSEALAQDRQTRLPDINGNWKLWNGLDYFDNQSNVAPEWTQSEMTEEDRNAFMAQMPVSDRIRNLIDPMPAWTNERNATPQVQEQTQVQPQVETPQVQTQAEAVTQKADNKALQEQIRANLKPIENYNAKEIVGQKEITQNLKNYVNMFGKDNPIVQEKFAEAMRLLNRFVETYNKDDFYNAGKAIEAIENELLGKTYTNKKGGVTEYTPNQIIEEFITAGKELYSVAMHNVLGTELPLKPYDFDWKSIDKMVGMYGNEYNAIDMGKVKGYLEDYLNRGDEQKLANAKALIEKIEGEMKGHQYKRKSDKQVFTYKDGNFTKAMNKIIGEVQAYRQEQARRAEAKKQQNTAQAAPQTKAPAVPQTEQQAPAVQTQQAKPQTDDSWARDLANAEAEAQYQQAQEQVPSLKKPKKSQKAQTQTEVPSIKKNETVNNAPIAQTEQTQAVPQVETQTQTQEQNPLVTIEPNGNPSITSQNTYKKSDAFSSKEAQNFLQENIENGTYDVESVSEDKSMDKAKSRLKEDYAGEARRLETDYQLDGYQVDEAMIIMQDKVNEAMRTGDWSEVRRFSAMVNQKIHKVAQSLQALAKHSRNSASAILKIERIVQDLSGNTANISDADLSEVAQIFDEAEKLGENSRERMELETQAYKILAKYIPNATFMEKWNAFRYLAMLGNTRTHIRNILGNFMFGAVTNVKDALAGTLESALLQDGKRTKSAFNHVSAEMLEAAKNDANNVWQELTDSGSNKYSMRNEIENERKIFNNKALEGLRKLNENLLTAEDNFALRNKYKRALGSYLESNGYDTSIFDSKNEADQKFLAEARKYAIQQAKIATFHEESRTADMLNQWSKAALAKDSSIGQKAAGIAIESMVPFKKTPINILKQGAVAYNPLQMFHGVYDALAHGDNPTKAIDEFSRGATGTAIMALGYALASIGALRPSDKEDSDLDTLTGEQAYSINAGNNSYTIDWAAPAALPLFVGAELYKAFDDSADFDFWSALSSVSDPVVEMSMLQGLKNSLESAASFASGKNTLGDTAINIGFGYGSQAVPTAMGQVARAVDDTRRSTYTGKTGTSDTILRNVKKIQNKIPGLSKLSEPWLDAWGETSENTGGSFLGRLAYNMLSPGYYSDTSKNATEQELYRLKEQMDNGTIENRSIIPSVADKTYNKERLSPSDYTQISRQKGQNSQNMYAEAISNPKYADMSDEQKADLLSSIKKFGNALSKAEIFGYDIEGSDTYKKRYEAYERGGVDGLINYMILKDALDGQTSAAATIEALDGMDMSDEEKIAFFKSGRNYSKKATYLDSIDPMYAYDWYKIKSTYGDSKSAMEYGILVSDLPEEEKQALLNVNSMKDSEVEYRMLIGQ